MKDSKYEEAMERAKQGLPIDEVFPELKESEDERIRKAIEGTIRVYGKTQGEWLCGYDMDTLVVHLREAFGALEKQKEQQPAEWSEEDETMLERCISKMTNIIPVPGKHGLEDMSFEKHTDEELVIWLNSLPKRFELQPKQEVVDRTVFDRIADILRWCDLPIGCPVENFKESESEREHLLNIVQCVAHRYANSCTYCKEYSRGYQDGLAVHHWKPSEEQMEALDNARFCKAYDRTELDSLYEQLNKLFCL